MKKLLIFISILFLTLSAFAQANKSAQDYLESGQTKFKAKKYKEAILDYNQAIKLNPNDANIYYHRSGAEGFSRNYKDALRDLNKAIELNPTDAEYYFDRGYINRFLGKYDDAIVDFNKSFEIGTDEYLKKRSKEEIEKTQNIKYYKKEKKENAKANIYMNFVILFCLFIGIVIIIMFLKYEWLFEKLKKIKNFFSK